MRHSDCNYEVIFVCMCASIYIKCVHVHVCSMCGAPLLHVDINSNEGRAPHMIQTEIENSS